MKSFVVSIILLHLIFISERAFCCTFSKHSGDIRVANISGAKVYTLFSTHIMENDWEEVLQTFSLPPNQAVAHLNGILKRKKETIESEESDANQIIDLVKKGEVRWVGVEATPGELNRLGPEVQVEDYLDMEKIFNQYVGHIKGWDQQKTNQILHLMYSPHIIARAKARMTPPDVFKQIPTIPIDDEKSKKESLDVMRKRDQSIDYLASLYVKEGGLCHRDQSQRPSWCSSLTSFVKTEDLFKIKRIPNSKLTRFFNQTEIENEEVKENIITLVESTNKFLDLSDKRDEMAASVILKQSGHGLVTMGLAHGPGVENRLTAACKNGSETRTNEAESIDSLQ